MFYIIGVSHRAHIKEKCATETAAQAEFRACLEQALGENHPALIAEELSVYALRKMTRERGSEQESLTALIAKSAGVEHRLCDPDDKERDKIGYVEGSVLAFNLAMTDEGWKLSNAEINQRGRAIEVCKYFPLREQCWLDQLHDVSDKVVIFVCGEAHVESFGRLLSKNGIESTVTKRGIGLDQYEHESCAEVMAYIKEHPELSF